MTIEARPPAAIRRIAGQANVTQPLSSHSRTTIEIRPTKGLFDLELAAIWRYRELLITLVKRDIQIVYRQAALGIGWAILQPVFAVVIFSIIFGHFARMPSDGIPYPVFSFAGVLPWTYFAEAVRRSSTGIVTDAELVRKVYFPRIVVPLSGVVAPILDLMIGLCVMLVMMLWYGVMPTWNLIAVIPLTVMMALMALSVGLWLGPLNVRFRDIKHTLPFLLQIWMYATPIVYPTSIVPEAWRWVFRLNPMVGIIDGFRWALSGSGELDLASLGVSAVILCLLIIGCLVFFRHMERTFADVI
jgi:lipopolysaccharide transport system permease protein